MVINVEKMALDFKNVYTSSEDIFPSSLIFDRTEWIKPENHMKIVRAEEEIGLGMNKENTYTMQPSFKIVYLSLADNAEVL
jgi:hypothetical protein